MTAREARIIAEFQQYGSTPDSSTVAHWNEYLGGFEGTATEPAAWEHVQAQARQYSANWATAAAAATAPAQTEPLEVAMTAQVVAQQNGAIAGELKFGPREMLTVGLIAGAWYYAKKRRWI